MAMTRTDDKSVTARALAVLDAFDAGHRHQTLAAISRRAKLPLSTTHRFVNQLVEAEALIRCSDGAYEIGSKLWQLGLLASVHADLRELALPYMEDIFQLGVDAVQIAVLDGMRCLVIDRIAGSRSMEVVSRPGARLPLHATGVGKVLLAFGKPDLQEAVLASLDKFTEKTITDPSSLRRQLKEIKAQGFAATKDELAMGAVSLGVPVRGYGGKVIAALGVVLPSTHRDIGHLVPVLRVTSDGLSRKLVASGVTDQVGLKP
jgi:DNA-binding IclR family transcriptional regulator